MDRYARSFDLGIKAELARQPVQGKAYAIGAIALFKNGIDPAPQPAAALFRLRRSVWRGSQCDINAGTVMD
jgi:hypothetical protein